MDNVIIAKKLSYLSDVLDQNGFSKEANTVDDVMLRIASMNVRLAQTASGDYQKDIETYRDMIAQKRYTESESFYKDATSKMRQINPATEQAFRAQAYRIRLTYQQSDKAGNVGYTGEVGPNLQKIQYLLSRFGLYSGHPNAPKTQQELDARFEALRQEARIMIDDKTQQPIFNLKGFQEQLTATYNLLLSQIAKQNPQVQSPFAYANEQARREDAYGPEFGYY